MSEVRISPYEEPKPSFRLGFYCENSLCVEKLLRALGFKTVPKIARYPVRIVFTDVAKVGEESCSGSLVSYDEDWEVLEGDVKTLAEKTEEVGCAAWTTTRYETIIRLEPGTLVHYYTRGYTGDRDEDSDTLIINPPRDVEVKKDGVDLVIKKKNGGDANA